MGFQPVVLITDALFFALLALAAVLIWRVRRDPLLSANWRKVGARPAAMASAVVLLCFVGVALLDSLHYRPQLPVIEGQEDRPPVYGVEVLSALDRLLLPLRERGEKTYSAPFAGQLFAMETVELDGGGQARIYPRLAHGAAHLEDPARETAADVAGRILRVLPLVLLAWAGLAGLLAAGLRRPAAAAGDQAAGGRETWSSALRRLLRGETELAWRAFLLSVGGLLLLLGLALALAGHYHLFGTDKVGQDVLVLTLKSIRTAVLIGTVTTLVMLPFALVLGILAGYVGGWVDDVIQYLYTVLNSIPGVLLIAAAVLMMQVVIDTHPHWFTTAAERADARLLALCLILGITSWTGLCRLLRGETLKLREMEYVQAARAFGVSTPRILWRHILPNVMHIVLIAVVMDFSGLVLAEAVLSYVGIGVDPSTASFGTMINNARMELAREPMVWWSLCAAFLFMFVLVLAANLLADAVRDAFDPRGR